MRIGIDARELGGRPTGVGRYLSQLLDRWAVAPEAGRHEFILYTPQPLDLQVGNLPVTVHVVGTPPARAGTTWEQVHLASAVRTTRPDVLFAPAYSTPVFVPCPVVVVMHDLSFMTHPAWFAPRERLRRTLLAHLAARRARLVLTGSAHIRDQIAARLRVGDRRLRVIPYAVTPITAPASSSALVRSSLVLFVGSIFNRRHVPDLIEAFALVARDHPDAALHVVGENRTHPAQDLAALVRRLGVGSQVTLHDYAPDDVVASLYARARAFAFLSEYEGFGFPPLEALAAGVPVIAVDMPVAREVLGNAALYVGTGDIEAVAGHLRRLLDDADVRRSILAEAPAVLTRYSWDETARLTLAALEEATGA